MRFEYSIEMSKDVESLIRGLNLERFEDQPNASLFGEGPSRDLMAQRNKALRLCWETGDYRLMDLAIETGLDKSTISRIVKGRRSQATPV